MDPARPRWGSSFSSSASSSIHTSPAGARHRHAARIAHFPADVHRHRRHQTRHHVGPSSTDRRRLPRHRCRAIGAHHRRPKMNPPIPTATVRRNSSDVFPNSPEIRSRSRPYSTLTLPCCCPSSSTRAVLPVWNTVHSPTCCACWSCGPTRPAHRSNRAGHRPLASNRDAHVRSCRVLSRITGIIETRRCSPGN